MRGDVSEEVIRAGVRCGWKEVMIKHEKEKCTISLSQGPTDPRAADLSMTWIMLKRTVAYVLTIIMTLRSPNVGVSIPLCQVRSQT